MKCIFLYWSIILACVAVRAQQITVYTDTNGIVKVPSNFNIGTNKLAPDALLSLLNRTNHYGNQTWATVSVTPVTLSGYGITDAQATNANLTTVSDLTGGTSSNFFAGNGTFKQVTTNDVPGLVEALASGGGGGSGGTKTIRQWNAQEILPTTSTALTAKPNIRGNGFAMWEMSGSTGPEGMIVIGVVPEGVSIPTMNINVHWLTSATTGSSVLLASVMKLSEFDIDSDSYDTAVSVAGSHTSAAGFVYKSSFSSVAADGLAAGDSFAIWLRRDYANASDTVTNHVGVVSIEARVP